MRALAKVLSKLTVDGKGDNIGGLKVGRRHQELAPDVDKALCVLSDAELVDEGVLGRAAEDADKVVVADDRVAVVVGAPLLDGRVAVGNLNVLRAASGAADGGALRHGQVVAVVRARELNAIDGEGEGKDGVVVQLAEVGRAAVDVPGAVVNLKVGQAGLLVVAGEDGAGLGVSGTSV